MAFDACGSQLQRTREGAPVVVLVHGSLDRATSFSRVARRLRDLPVVSYDRRGYGRSRSLPVARDLQGHVQDLFQVIGDGPAVVVGHSFGAAVALAAAVGAPAKVAAVCAYEPPLPWMPWWPHRGQEALAGADPAAYAEAFFRRMVGDDAWKHLSEEGRAERIADGPALVAELSAIRVDEPLFDIGQLVVPAVLARGSCSSPHHRRSPEVLHAAAPGSQLVDVEGARHGAHLSHPDAFAALVRRTVAATRGRVR